MPIASDTQSPRRARTPDALFDLSKRLDLAAIACAELGFLPHPEKDTARWRLLVHINGTKLLLWKADSTGHWLWRPADEPASRTRTIFDLFAERQGLKPGQVLAKVRRWRDNPLPAVPVRGDHTGFSERPTIARPGLEGYGPVTEPRWFRDNHISEDVTRIYGHAIRQHSSSLAIVFPHDDTPGEIRNFRPGQKAATGAQMSIWAAEPKGLPVMPIVRVVVGESAPRCLAWAQAHPDLRAGTLLVSTAGGSVSAAGRAALHELLTTKYPDALVCDIYDGAGDPVGEKATARLKEEFGHARYRDFKPTSGVKDWEKELVRRAEQVQTQLAELHPGFTENGVEVGESEDHWHH